MKKLKNISSSKLLIIFFALTYTLSWIGNLFELHSILPPGPLIIAVILLGVTAGKPAVKDFLRRIVDWRVGFRWYAFVLLLPVALMSLAVGINILIGANFSSGFQTPEIGDVLVTFIFIMLFIGLGEEPAWRGFALPRLMKNRSVLMASLLLGALHVVWHLPLLGLEYHWNNVLPWAITTIAYSVVAAWMYVHTKGNLLLPILIHTSQNVMGAFVFSKAFNGSDVTSLWWLMATNWFLVALFIVIKYGKNLGTKKLINSLTYAGQNS